MENQNNIKNKNVETYAEDMAKIISVGEGNDVRRMIEEQEKSEADMLMSSPQSTKNKYLIFFSIFLILCAFGSLFFLFSYKKENSTVSVEQKFVPIIYLDDTEFADIGGLTKDQISQNILNSVAQKEIKSEGVMGV